MNRNQAMRHRLQQQAVSYDHRQANAAKRAATWAKAELYDEPVTDDNGKAMESPLLSDHGRGAAIIRAVGELPRWKASLAEILETYSATDRERIEAIADHRKLADAARSLNISRMTLYRLKADLRQKLAVVLQMATGTTARS